MLRINDDSDELFRKAAEHYPLKVGDGDWELVRKKLNDWTEEETIAPARKPNKRFPFILIACAGLLLLAPKAVFDLVPVWKSDSKGSNNRSLSEIPGNQINFSKESGVRSNQNLPVDVKASPAIFTGSGNIPGNHTPTTIASIPASGSRTAADPVSFPVADKLNNEPFLQHSNIPSIETKNPPVFPVTAGQNIPGTKSPEAENIVKIEIDPDKKIVTVPDTEISKKEKTNSTTSEKKPGKRTPHFYAGLLAGADMSMVKMQSVEKIGFSAGILIGYQYNKRFSIETGLLWDKKNYSTDGKYFNPKNAYLPNYGTILYATGVCNMFELPVNIRYNLFAKEKSNFFVSAGASSYIMKKEDYDYKIKHYNNIYIKSYSYKNSSTNLFSVINLSAGFEKHIGEKFRLRAEPYVKIPVNKVGIGNLPLQSAGLNIGFTRSF